MLGLEQARKTYDNNPEDPYVVLPGNENIEIRFAEDGTITGAFSIETEPSRRWYSGEMQEYLLKQRGGFIGSVVQRKEESGAEVNTPPQPARPRPPQRVRLDPAEAFRGPLRRR